MLPDNVLSSEYVPGDFIPPDDKRRTLTKAWQLGGAAIGDTSEGLQNRVWVCETDGFNINVYPETSAGDTVVITTDFSISEVSLAFDQNMRPVIAYVAGSMAKLYWYDSTAEANVTTELPGVISPMVALDDKRDSATNAGTSDVIFAYIKNGGFFYRQQRDRYTVERELAEVAPGRRIWRMGLGTGLRMLFEFEI